MEHHILHSNHHGRLGILLAHWLVPTKQTSEIPDTFSCFESWEKQLKTLFLTCKTIWTHLWKNSASILGYDKWQCYIFNFYKHSQNAKKKGHTHFTYISQHTSWWSLEETINLALISKAERLGYFENWPFILPCPSCKATFLGKEHVWYWRIPRWAPRRMPLELTQSISLMQFQCIYSRAIHS